MAGVAPQHRSGGSNATTIGMVVSIVVNVALLATLIFLFTNQEQLRTDTDRARSSLAKIAGGAEGPAKQMFPDYSGAGKTLVGVMNQWVQTTAGRVTGNQNDSPQIVLQSLDSVLNDIREAGQVPNPDDVAPSQGAVAILKKLHELYVAELNSKTTALASLKKAHDDLSLAQEANQAQKQTFDSSVAALNDKVATIQKGKTDLENTKNADIAALERKNNDKRNEIASMTRQHARTRARFALDVREIESDLDMQRRALGGMRGPSSVGAQPLSIARSPIGRVIRALPGDSLVHVGLGRQDRVNLGMRLAIYSSRDRVPADGRGKANVEVVSVGPTTAECKVVTPPSPDDPILEGDGVGNIVLNRSVGRKTRFCVIGQFDLDGDNVPEPRGRDAVMALIAQYGGEVVSRVDANTDYLVVGIPSPDWEDGPFGGDFDVAAFGDDPDGEFGEASEEDDDDEWDDEGEEDEDEDDEDDEDEEDEDDEYDEDEEDEDDEDEEDGDDDEEGDDEGIDEDDEMDDEAESDDTNGADIEESSDRWPGLDPTREPRIRIGGRKRMAYERAIRRADALMIPRLTLEHFLNFVGIEPGRDAVRRLEMN